MSAPHRTRGRALAVVTLAVLLAVPCATAPPASAVADAGSVPVVPPPPGEYPAVPPGTYEPPVEAPVSDPFRLEHGPYGPGNRGLEYATTPGQPVRAVAAGRIAFAGPVAGRLAVSVDHPDGRRSSLTGLDSIVVRVGTLVARGTIVGTAGPSLHLGLREGSRYIDPAPFFAVAPRRAVLVPVDDGRRAASG